jgi:hypothetical protein
MAPRNSGVCCVSSLNVLTWPVLSSTKPIMESETDVFSLGVQKEAPWARSWWQEKRTELTIHQMAGELPLP